MRNCQRCGGEVSWTNDKVSLYGGVSAHLCTKCETEWDRVFMDHPLTADLFRLSARGAHYHSLALARQPVGEEAWAELTIGKARIERRFLDIGVEFVKPLPEVAEAERGGNQLRT
jgi:hypothetical protein